MARMGWRGVFPAVTTQSCDDWGLIMRAFVERLMVEALKTRPSLKPAAE